MLLASAAITVRVAAYFRTQSRKPVPAPHPQRLGPYDVAMLLGNSGRVVETALTYLVDSGAVGVHPGRDPELQPRQDAHQRARDPVQRQVLDLIPHSRNLHLLTFAFARTDVAGHLRSRMASYGLMVVHRRHMVVTWLIRALFVLPLIATATFVGLEHTSGNVLFAMLLGHLFVTIIPMLLCEGTLPLNVTRSGKALRKAIENALDEQDSEHDVSAEDAGKAGGIVFSYAEERSAEDLPKAGETVFSHAEEWGLEPEWFGSAAGLVPFLGLDGYLGEQGERITFQHYDHLTSGIIRTPQGQNRRLGLAYRSLGVICTLFGVYFGLSLFHSIMHFLLAWILISVGVRLTRLGRKHRTPVHQAPARPQQFYAGSRPPVLYLRSFDHDALLETPGPKIRSALFGARTSYVEELATAVRPFGNMVAIGNPADSLPGLGPSHIYVPPQLEPERVHGQLALWQSEVLRLVHSSSLVLISAGHGNGLRWEFEQVTSLVSPQRLVVLVPLSRAGYQRFRAQTSAYFWLGLPDDPRKKDTYSREGREQIHGLIYFEQDWTPHFVPFKERPLAQLHLGRVAVRPSMRKMRNRLIHAMYPVFRGNRAHWQGLQVAVPFGKTSRHRVAPGASWASTAFLLVVAAAFSLPLLAWLGILR
ncbi:TIGR04222 domain-containing membrane protein [Streptomyces sp. HNM0574]|nr:TIGR04222 domain-containing membrane protein [Streptomyces sp. HNM0574]